MCIGLRNFCPKKRYSEFHLNCAVPPSELRRTLLRVSVSVAKKDKMRFLNIAQASADECACFLILIQDLNYAQTQDLSHQLDAVSRILQGYLNAMFKP
jgi:hypothetical protein